MIERIKKLFRVNDKERPVDPWLLFSAGVLLLFGLVALSSASAIVSYWRFGNSYHFLFRQLIAIAISLALFFVFYKIDYRVWRRYALWALLASIVLLVLVFVPGLRAEHGTARSWIVIFGQSFQPAELVKLSFLIYLATWLEAKKGQLHQVGSGIVPFVASLLIIGALIMSQPDLGTFFIIIFSAFVAFFVAGGRLSHIIITALLGVLALALLVHASASYRSVRFACFQNPTHSTQEECYQINQALIATGSGGLMGKGFGESRQKFMYLPEVWGDAIFPIIAEEIGFVFSLFLILLFALLFYRGIKIAANIPDVYGKALAVGIIAWFSVQTFLNIGGMINLIPMTGVPLPFISAGGSSIMAVLMAMGILANMSKHCEYGKKKYRK